MHRNKLNNQIDTKRLETKKLEAEILLQCAYKKLNEISCRTVGHDLQKARYRRSTAVQIGLQTLASSFTPID